MKKIKYLFIDDIREPDWFIQTDTCVARTYREAIEWLKEEKFDWVSFDHDLGTEKTGYDIAKYIVENQIDIGGFKVHSANPVGRFNIVQLLEHYGYKQKKYLDD